MSFRWVAVRGGPLLAVMTLVTALQGCAPLIVGGAMVGGTMMALDRRTSGTQVEDEAIELKAAQRLRQGLSDKAHFNVTSYNRQVLLTGEAGSETERERAGEIATRVENVANVINEMAVLPVSSLSERSNDTLITTRVKSALIDAKDVQTNAFKIVTERGNVYMMGRVTQQEAERATQVVRGVAGVRKVIRVLEIISNDELKALESKNAKPAPPSGAGTPGQ
jgi:osmotically-inducible protein OsmY